MTVNKDFLKSYIFSDQPEIWVIHANGFLNNANALLQIQKPPYGTKRMISGTEIQNDYQHHKVACFLYSISIELYLKALYSHSRTDETNNKTEEFSHKVKKIYDELVIRDVLKKTEIDEEVLELAGTILWWYGRYYMPLYKDVSKVIDNCFKPSSEVPDMLEPKFQTSPESAIKLKALATFLSGKTPVNPSSVINMLFPF